MIRGQPGDIGLNLIDVKTLVVGALLYLVAIFVQPLVLVIRDKLVWIYIKKRLFNEQVIDDIVRLARENELWFQRVFIESLFLLPESDGSYVIHFEGEGNNIDPIIVSASGKIKIIQ